MVTEKVAHLERGEEGEEKRRNEMGEREGEQNGQEEGERRERRWQEKGRMV